MDILNTGSFLHLVNDSHELLRSVENGDGKTVFKTTDVGIGMGGELVKILGASTYNGVKIPKISNFLDQGSGNGFLGAIASTQQDIYRIMFNDTNPLAIEHSKKMTQSNRFFDRANFLVGDDLSSLEGIDFCVSNLPQNPNLDFCGEGGSELQVGATLKIGEKLTPGGLILSKDVGYAKSITQFSEISKIFHIHLIQQGSCINPNTRKPSTVDYYLLQKKG